MAVDERHVRNKYSHPSLNQVSLKVIAVTSLHPAKKLILYYRSAKSQRVFRSKIRENQKFYVHSFCSNSDYA